MRQSSSRKPNTQGELALPRVLLTTSPWNSAITCAQSFSAQGCKVDVISELRSTPLNFSRHIDGCHFAPSERDAAQWQASLLKILHHNHYDLLIPISDRAVNIVSQARSQVQPLVNVVLPSARSMAIASDKARTTRMAIACGIPVPPSRFPQSLDEMRQAIGEIGLPAVVKVPISTGSEGVRISADVAQLLAFAQARQNPGNQPFLQAHFRGSNIGVNTLVVAGKIVACHSYEVDPAHQMSGNAPFAREIHDPVLVEYAATLARELDWTGPLGFDFLRAEDGSCVFLETNPRFPGSLSFATQAGIDMPAMLLDIAAGRVVPSDRPAQAGQCERLGLTQELRWWRADIRQRTRAFLSFDKPFDVINRQRLSDPGLFVAQIIDAFRR